VILAHADYQDPADTERGWDDETTSVDECAHGEHPIECSLCTSAGFHAAVSGEEEDMSEEESTAEEREQQAYTEIMKLIDLLSPRRCGALRNVLEIKLRQDAEAHEKLARDARAALAALGTRPRKQRSDAGTTRPRKTEAA